MNKKNKDTEQLSLAGTEEGEILAKLSERVERAVKTIQQLRRERDELQSQVTKLEGEVHGHGQTAERAASLEEDNDRFKQERGEIRSRIESILSALETIGDGEGAE